jgi:hypothetical protein
MKIFGCCLEHKLVTVQRTTVNRSLYQQLGALHQSRLPPCRHLIGSNWEALYAIRSIDMPLSGDVKRELRALFSEETRRGSSTVEVSATDLHLRLEFRESESSSTSNRVAVCGAVLVAMMDANSGDTLLRESESDPSVRFVLPRPSPSAPPV